MARASSSTLFFLGLALMTLTVPSFAVNVSALQKLLAMAIKYLFWRWMQATLEL